MPNYRRNRIAGGTYFFTLVTYRRRPWLCEASARAALRQAVASVKASRPFDINAWVLLPDHIHCIWTLPRDDDDYALRWRSVKLLFARQLGETGGSAGSNTSRSRRKERTLWQRRFWEHTIRDERDMETHCAYIHYNPVKHGLCASPEEWPFSTFHRFVREGVYPKDWGAGVEVIIPDGVGRE